MASFNLHGVWRPSPVCPRVRWWQIAAGSGVYWEGGHWAHGLQIPLPQAVPLGSGGQVVPPTLERPSGKHLGYAPTWKGPDLGGGGGEGGEQGVKSSLTLFLGFSLWGKSWEGPWKKGYETSAEKQASKGTTSCVWNPVWNLVLVCVKMYKNRIWTFFQLSGSAFVAIFLRLKRNQLKWHHCSIQLQARAHKNRRLE